MPPSEAMPRAKRARMHRIYYRILSRIDYDIDHSNAARLGIMGELNAARHHVNKVLSIIGEGL